MSSYESEQDTTDRIAQLRLEDVLMVKCSAESHAPKVAKIATFQQEIDTADGDARRPPHIGAGRLHIEGPPRSRGYPAVELIVDAAGRPLTDEAGNPLSGLHIDDIDEVRWYWHDELRCPLCGLALRADGRKLQLIVEKLIDDGESEIELHDLRRRYS